MTINMLTWMKVTDVRSGGGLEVKGQPQQSLGYSLKPWGNMSFCAFDLPVAFPSMSTPIRV